jgi:dTDP-4-amino-4,6-dideoxygalactose transaminase
MSWKIPLFDLDFNQEETNAVVEVLNSRWLTMGEKTQEFEAAFTKFVGCRHAFTVSNGTTALHLALAAAGIGPGDEVILPSLTFVATANAVLYTGATPVFADIVSPDDLTIDPKSIETLITPKTKAIMVMHYAGFPCHMEKIMALANAHQLMVFEDAAHSPGAKLNGTSCGMFGVAGCFSFFTNKNMSMGEGGMVTTEDDDLAAKIKLMRSHGMTSLTLDRYKGHNYSYDVVELGYNYRPTEMNAVLGMVQLKKLPANNAKRKAINQYYYQHLKDAKGLTVPFMTHPGDSVYHVFPVLLNPGIDRTEFMKAMKDAGIQTSIHYPPIHKFTYHKNLTDSVRGSLKITEDVCAREVTLPLFPALTPENVDYIVSVIHAFMNR